MWDLGILQAGWSIQVSITLPNDPSTSSTILKNNIATGLTLWYLDNSNPSKIQYVSAVTSGGTFAFTAPTTDTTSFSGTYTIYFPSTYSGTTSDFQLGFKASAATPGSLSLFAYMSIQVDYFNGTGYSVGSTSSAQTLLKVTETARDDVLKVFYVAPSSPAFQFAFYPFKTTSTTNTANPPVTTYSVTGDFNMNLYSITLTGTDTSLTANEWTLTAVTSVVNSDKASTSSPPFALSDSLEQLNNGNSFTLTGNVSNWGFTLPTGFYVLEHYYVGTPPTTDTPWFTFQTDSYACPYNPDFVDYYENFQGCTVSSAIQGVPCAAFD